MPIVNDSSESAGVGEVRDTERSIIREAESNGQSSVSIDAEMLEPVTLPVETERAAYVPFLHSI